VITLLTRLESRINLPAVVFAVLTPIEIPHGSFEHLRLWVEEGHAGSDTDRKISCRSETLR
jgi:hypothetical protein